MTRKTAFRHVRDFARTAFPLVVLLTIGGCGAGAGSIDSSPDEIDGPGTGGSGRPGPASPGPADPDPGDNPGASENPEEPDTGAAESPSEPGNPGTSENPDTSENPAPAPVGRFGPYDDQAREAEARYSGNRDESLLDARSSSLMFDALLFGPFGDHGQTTSTGTAASRVFSVERVLAMPFLDLRIWGGSALGSGTHECADDGEIELVESSERDSVGELSTLHARYHACADTRSVFSGSAFVAWAGRPEDRSRQYAGFDRLVIEVDDRKIEISGAISWTGIGGCATQHNRFVMLHLKVLGSDEELLFRDMEFESWGLGDRSCSTAEPMWVSFDGELLHSEHGKARVSTPNALPYAIDVEPPSLVATHDGVPGETGKLTGKVVMIGAGDTTASFGYDNIPIQTDLAGPTTIAELTVDDATDDPFRAHRASFLRGSLSELNDTDTDGMPDSWESVHGLNPADGGDAGLDSDEDSLSNLDEYRHQSIPDDRAVPNTRFEPRLSIYFDRYYEKTRPYLEVRTYLYENDFDGELLEGDSYELKLDGEAVWDTKSMPDGCGLHVDDASVVQCLPGHDGTLRVWPREVDSTIVVTGGIGAIEVGEETEGIFGSKTLEYEHVEFGTMDFRVNAASSLWGNPDDSRTSVLTVEQLSPFPSADATLEATFSDAIVITNAEFRPWDAQGPLGGGRSCTIVEKVRCDISGSDLGGEYLVAVEYEYFLLSDGEHVVEWSVRSDATESDMSQNKASTTIQYVQSTAALQEIIDTSADGDTVTLPAGKYNGTLNGRGKTLHVKGASTDGGTVLMSTVYDKPVLVRVGDHSTYSDLVLQSTSAYILSDSGYNITIRDSVITPVPSFPHTVFNLFNSSSYRLLGNHVEGWGGGENRCDSMLYLGNLYGRREDPFDFFYFSSETYEGGNAYDSNNYPSRVDVRNTLFVNNECNHLIRSEDFANDLTLHFVNNTLVNNRGKSYFAQDGRADVRVENNVLLDSHFTIQAYRVFKSDDSELTVARNLVWQSESEGPDQLVTSIVPSEMRDWIGVRIEDEDINVDPLFVDAENGDYRLSAISPAIDSGVVPPDYVWYGLDGQPEPVQPAPEEQPSAVDGSGDGEAEFDIGAFEFQM